MPFPQTQVFAADGAVAESSQSGTPQGEGRNFMLSHVHTLYNITVCLLSLSGLNHFCLLSFNYFSPNFSTTFTSLNP